IEGTGKAVGDTWEGLKSTYELGRTIMGPFSPLLLGNEVLFNRDQLLENQRKHQEFYLGIINDPIGKVRRALDMPKYIWSAVTTAWERDVINGDTKSRTAFFTYGLTSLGIGILGDKGIGKAGTIAKSVRQAGKGEKALPIYTPVQTPAMAGGGLARGPVPYNVLFDPLTKIKMVTEDVFGVKGIGITNQHIRTYRNANLKKLEEKYTADPRITVEMPYVGKGKSGTNAEGWLRDKDFYWKEIMNKHPESLSKVNKQKINLGFSPINDKAFREHFPQYDIKELYNDTLIHHHVGGGGQAVAVPSKLHPGTGGIHNAEKAAGIWGNDSQYAELLEKFLKK
ncbi:hypothetical protein, partial [Cytobacillus firmus]